VGIGVLGIANNNTASLIWGAATDDRTKQDDLRYFVYLSSNNNITTVAECMANGTLLNENGTLNITNYDVTGLISGTTYYFNVVVSDEAGNKSAYHAVSLTTTVGIVDFSSSSFIIFPNPAKEELTIVRSTTGKAQIEIHSLDGKKISVFEIFETKSEINLSFLSAGIYMIILCDNKNTEIQRFVKK
jgi:hypothetical protein